MSTTSSAPGWIKAQRLDADLLDNAGRLGKRKSFDDPHQAAQAPAPVFQARCRKNNTRQGGCYLCKAVSIR